MTSCGVLAWRAHAEPGAGLVALHGFGDASARPGNSVGALLRGHGKRAELAALDVRQIDDGMLSNITWHWPPMHVGQRRVRAAIRHVGHLHAGHLHEQFAGHDAPTCRCRTTPC